MNNKEKTPAGGNRSGASQMTTGNRHHYYSQTNDGRQQEIPVHSESGRVIAKVVGNELRKTIRGSKHMLKQPPAIGFDRCALEQAESAGAVKVRVVDQETGIIYKAQLEQFWRDGVRLNRGFGNQIALPLAGWIQQKKGCGSQLGFLE